MLNENTDRATRMRLLFLIALFAVAWIYEHPYKGIWHDGNLYLGQALFHISPELYRHDLFFKYGSQDQFTLFSPVYAWAIKQFGMSVAPMSFALISQCLFAIALLLCCVRLFGAEIGLWSASAVVLVSHGYGGFNVFSYSETFVTARSFAEPFCLFAIWLLLIRHAGWSLIVLLLATLIHPLTSLPCMLFWGLYMVAHDKRWLWLGVGLLVLPLLAAFGISPFDKLFQTYDLDWWTSVQEFTRPVLPLRWTLANWAAFGFDAILIWFGSRFMDKQLRDFLRVVLLTAIIGIFVSIAGTSLLQNVLITSIQLWRAHWILHLFAVSTIPYIVFKLWPIGDIPKFVVSFIIVAAYLLPYPASFGAVLLAAWLYRYHKHGASLSRAMKLIFLCAIILMIVLKSGFKILEVLNSDSNIFHLMWEQKLLRIAFAWPLFLGGAIVLGWLAYQPRYRVVAQLGLLLSLVPALAMWDMRTSWQKYLEQDHPEAHPFHQYLKSDGEVYWYGQLLAPWVLLKAPSYFENSQGAGLLFNRDTSTVFSTRNKALNLLHFQTQICEMTDFLNGDKECQPSFEVVQDACSISPNLDAMILPWKVMGMEGKEWSILLPGDKHETSYYLYKCDTFRR